MIKTVFVSSSARSAGQSGESYTVFLQNPVKDIFKAELLYASIPNTILNIIDGTDVITVNSNIFSIPKGFYSSSGMATELTQAIGPVSGVTVSFLPNEGLFVFYKAASSFSLTINSIDLSEIVGIPIGTYSSVAYSTSGGPAYPLYNNNSLYATYGNFYKAQSITNAQPIDTILLDIQELRSPTMFTGIASNCYGSSGFNPFAVIPVDVVSGNYINFRKGSNFDFDIEYPYPIERLDRLTVRWTDINNKLVNFNQLDDNFFMLRLHTTRKSQVPERSERYL